MEAGLFLVMSEKRVGWGWRSSVKKKKKKKEGL